MVRALLEPIAKLREYAQRYLAIDQGPIAVMIENYRSGLLWKLFMSHPDVQAGLTKLGFNTNKQDVRQK